MANDYYDNSTPADRFQPGVTARGSEVDDKFDEVEAAFGKLPGAAATGKGFDEPIHVGNATAGTHAVPLDQALDKVAEWVNASIYDATTEYSFSDVVIGSDGVTYRFVGGSPATGDDPVTSSTGSWASYGGGIETLGTLTASMTVGQEVSISLSGEVETPFISATKEVVDTGVTNSDWNVTSDGSNYDIEDFAYNTSLTPSATSGTVSLTMGSGSFATDDVGKRITINGGEALLKAADGTAEVVKALNSTSSAESGEWAMYGVSYDINGAKVAAKTYEGFEIENYYDTGVGTSLDGGSQRRALRYSNDGGFLYYIDNSTDAVYQHTLSTPYDLTTSSSYKSASNSNGNAGLDFKDDGTKMFVFDSSYGTIYQYTLTTPWDIATQDYDGVSFDIDTETPRDINFVNDGASIIYTDGEVLKKSELSTPWDITTIGAVQQTFTLSAFSEYVALFPDGTGFFHGDGSTIVQVDMSSPYDLSTAVYSSNSITVEAEPSSNQGIVVSSSGKWIFYGVGHPTYDLYKVQLKDNITAINEHFPLVTSSPIKTEYWDDINSLAADDTPAGQFIYYAISLDDKQSFRVMLSGSGSRMIVRNNAGTWEYNSDNSYEAETWVEASRNSNFGALSEAMSIIPNQMDAAQLAEVGDAEIPATTETLDLAVVLYTEDANDIPVFHGFLINYDANAKQDLAVPGTDYEWDQPDSMTIRFTALTAQNFKARVI